MTFSWIHATIKVDIRTGCIFMPTSQLSARASKGQKGYASSDVPLKTLAVFCRRTPHTEKGGQEMTPRGLGRELINSQQKGETNASH